MPITIFLFIDKKSGFPLTTRMLTVNVFCIAAAICWLFSQINLLVYKMSWNPRWCNQIPCSVWTKPKNIQFTVTRQRNENKLIINIVAETFFVYIASALDCWNITCATWRAVFTHTKKHMQMLYIKAIMCRIRKLTALVPPSDSIRRDAVTFSLQTKTFAIRMFWKCFHHIKKSTNNTRTVVLTHTLVLLSI